MDQSQFQQLAEQGYARVPVYREVFSDLDTPLSVYLKLADGPNAFLFESVAGGEQWGRFSIIGLPARTVFRAEQGQWRRYDWGKLTEAQDCADPLLRVSELLQHYRLPELDELPKFHGGLVGYFGYETIAHVEPRLAGEDDRQGLGTPEMCLMLAEEVAVFDNLSGKLFLIVCADPSEAHAWETAQRRLDQLIHRLRAPGPGYPEVLAPETFAEDDFRSGFSREAFEAAVARCKDYIAAGDVMQVVLSQRLSIEFRARPVDVYRALRSLNPSPYMYFLDLGDTQVVGSSPEILMRVEDDEVVVRPIAGTRPRGGDAQTDAALEAELLADPKERAEHLMLIDLGRNDIGRVAQTGSVRLTENMGIERYSHVMHIVSEVRGRLRPELDAVDVFRATFPAGTLSGAPKVRAMEIIRELEPVQRNVYAGAVGYLGWQGDADMAIAIRTAVIRDGMLHVQAGAGIVHDSDPAAEWEETMNKGRALFHAVSQAAGGL